jgi:hypothetical protein
MLRQRFGVLVDEDIVDDQQCVEFAADAPQIHLRGRIDPQFQTSRLHGRTVTR